MKNLIFLILAVSVGCSKPSAEPRLAPVVVAPTPTPAPKALMPAFDAHWGLTQSVYAKAVAYYTAKHGTFRNQRYVTIVDFNLSSSTKRLFLFDLKLGSMERHLVAHGAGSDPNDTGFATKFSDGFGTHMSSLGAYITLTIGSYRGYSLSLDGLEPTNAHAEPRAILMHQAPYVREAGGHVGRSWGCFAIDPNYGKSIIDRVAGGSLIYAGR